MRKKEVEICCGDIGSVIAAAKGGARRIELCCGLSDGGLTPSSALIKAAVDCGIEKVNVLIRPRGGDFLYDRNETNVMIDDIKYACDCGATGIVIGALTEDGHVDTDKCRRLIESFPGKDITFHRAFDMVEDPYAALEDIVSLGCTSLLTSGLAPSAIKGIKALTEISGLAEGRITVMAGSGVNSTNCREILQTGVDAVHATARHMKRSGMRFHREDVKMGAGDIDEYGIPEADPGEVRKLIEIADSYGI